MNIPGAADLIKTFGRWPSFHDAEVVRFVIERSRPYALGPHILAQLHVFEMTKEVDADGPFILENHTLVSFRFLGVEELELEEFNSQNVLLSLAVDDIRSRQLEALNYEIHFVGSFGLDARFLCREIVIEDVRPWEENSVTSC